MMALLSWAKGASIGYLAQHQDLEGAETIYDALLEVKKPVIQMEARIRSLELEMKSASGDELETKLSEYSRLNHEFEMADGYSYQSEITGVLKGLGFTEDEFSKPDHRSFRRPEDPCFLRQTAPYQTGHPAP